MTEQLRGHPLFARVDEAHCRAAARAAEYLRVERGAAIYDRHRFRRCLGLLLEGRVQVQKESLLVSQLSAGDVFGAAALFSDGEDYPTQLVALTDCRLLLIPQESICRLLRECGPFAEDYVRYLSGRIRFLSRRLDAVSAGNGEGKLAQYLLGAGEAVTLSATQLSRRLGVGRATLYRAFEVLEGADAIAREGKTIRILNREKLQSYERKSMS